MGKLRFFFGNAARSARLLMDIQGTSKEHMRKSGRKPSVLMIFQKNLEENIGKPSDFTSQHYFCSMFEENHLIIRKNIRICRPEFRLSPEVPKKIPRKSGKISSWLERDSLDPPVDTGIFCDVRLPCLINSLHVDTHGIQHCRDRHNQHPDTLETESKLKWWFQVSIMFDLSSSNPT